MTVIAENSKEVSAWSPFSNTGFTLLWTAALISNIGTWMHDVGAGWLMSSLNPSPGIVSLVQAATTLPIFLFALFAGALADRLNKKTMLLMINIFLTAVIASLAVIVQFELVTPQLLLVYTFVIGSGAAFMAPAWQSIVPSLVPKPQLKAAIALNSLGINISRAIGPALAGVLISAIGLSAPFALNAMSHVVIILALLSWRQPEEKKVSLPPEPLLASMATGFRHAMYNKPLKDTMIRALGFYFFASAYWAMLPLIARTTPGGGAEVYGVLLGLIGAGAVVGAVMLPRIRKRFSSDKLVVSGTIGTAIALLLFAYGNLPAVLYFTALLAGASWITVLTSFNVSAQMALPNWVRARGLAVYMMVFFGSMAAGATVWGQVADLLGIPVTLCVASAFLLLLIPVTRHARLGAGEEMDLTPSNYWPSPIISDDLDNNNDDRGPVMVTIDYCIEPADETKFLNAVHELSNERYRDGAYEWGVYQNIEDEKQWTEWFLLSSWQEHLRQHERVTEHDKTIQEKLHRLHKGEGKPTVRHLLAPLRTQDK